MSETELHTGKLEVFSSNFNRNEFDSLIDSEKLNSDGYDVMEEDFFILYDNNGNRKYIFNKGTLYKVKEWKEHDDTGFIHETSRTGNEINFTYLFYNGGTCEQEMIEEGLDSLNN